MKALIPFHNREIHRQVVYLFQPRHQIPRCCHARALGRAGAWNPTTALWAILRIASRRLITSRASIPTAAQVALLDLLTRTTWQLDINLPADQACFTTRSFWHNSSGLDQPYYT